MTLSIDTSDNRKIQVWLDGKKFEKKLKKPGTQALLTLLDEAIRQSKAGIKDIKKIKINLGPGSFTGLRVGVAVANTLAWTLNIPINNLPVGKLVSPKYG